MNQFNRWLWFGEWVEHYQPEIAIVILVSVAVLFLLAYRIGVRDGRK
jgi:hypothetical protein